MTYIFNKSFLRADFDDNSLLFNVKDHSTYTLNHTAAFIIQQIIKKVPMAAIAAIISAAFDVKPSLAEKDCKRLIKELKKRGVLHGSTNKK